MAKGRYEGRHVENLAPQQAFDEAVKVLGRDKRRYSGVNYPAYKGKTTAPMSTLTQRARGLRQGFAEKPAPYTRKLESVLNRPGTGISEQNIQGQTQRIAGEQQGFSDTQMLGALRKQFRESYNPNIDRFRGKGQGDIRSEANRAAEGFRDIGRTSGTLEKTSNEQLVKALKSLQSQKEDRRGALTGMLDQFGAQKHGYTNLANKASQNEFNEEANAPFKKMDMLREALRPLQGETELGVNPDRQSQAGIDALQSLRAYGVDLSSPMGQWSGKPNLAYQGQLIADLPAEISASQATLESMNPKYKDTLYEQRKNLTKKLMGSENISEQAMGKVPQRMRGEIESLESEAQNKLKKDLKSISSKFTRANQYGSPQHRKAAEDRAREISKATFGERNKLLQESMKSELSAGHKGQISDLRKLGLQGEHGQKEFGDVMSAIKDMNTLGSTKWGNRQAENEELYKTYQDEAAWQWPHMKGQIAGDARRGAFGNVYKGMPSRNISLDELSNLDTHYSENEKEIATAREDNSSLRQMMDSLKNKAESARQREAKKSSIMDRWNRIQSDFAKRDETLIAGNVLDQQEMDKYNVARGTIGGEAELALGQHRGNIFKDYNRFPTYIPQRVTSQQLKPGTDDLMNRWNKMQADFAPRVTRNQEALEAINRQALDRPMGYNEQARFETMNPRTNVNKFDQQEMDKYNVARGALGSEAEMLTGQTRGSIFPDYNRFPTNIPEHPYFDLNEIPKSERWMYNY